MTEEYNLYPLHVFLIVARLGSVTRAAQELCISQPAVSWHLKSLEARYNEPLFERTPRGMLLTPPGESVAEQAGRVFALLSDMESAVHSARGMVRGKITLAASSTPGTYLVPRLLRRFQDCHPDVEPTLLVGDSRDVLSWLHEYRIGIGIVGETVMEEGLIREEIGQDELRLVVDASNSLGGATEVTGKDISGLTLFLREHGSSTRAGAETLLCGWMQDFSRIVELNSTEAIKQAVIAGLGVAVLSSWATELEEKAGLLHALKDSRLTLKRRFYLVRRKDRPLFGTVEALWISLSSDGHPSKDGIAPEPREPV